MVNGSGAGGEVVPMWSSVPMGELLRVRRWDAAFFCAEAGRSRQDVLAGKYPAVSMMSHFVESAFYPGRYKRIYVDEENGVPFLLPSQITEIMPEPVKFISPRTAVDIESAKVTRGQILMTRSGTVGVVSFACGAYEGLALSDDIIRITARAWPGCLYAYLKSDVARAMVGTSHYGAVIKHIEPAHLDEVLIPNAPAALQEKIHDLIARSFELRDESNDLMRQAWHGLQEAFALPNAADEEIMGKRTSVLHFSVSSDQLDGRFDASYHLPAVGVIKRILVDNAREVTTVGDGRISRKVVLPKRFKRVYVEKDHGVVFVGGSEIGELDPESRDSGRRYLSRFYHGQMIKRELAFVANSTLITCSGTVGRVAIVPRHWHGWAGSQHIIRVLPANDDVAGYLYAWLSSAWGRMCIRRCIYGAVIDEIDARQVARVVMPLCRDGKLQSAINEAVLDANGRRAEAYRLEREALRVLNDEVMK